MPGRTFAQEDYRYGFQGQETDDELRGDGNSVNYKYRMHDARIGRFFAVDPLSSKFPWYSAYQFAGNTPLWKVELEGLEPGTPELQEAQDNLGVLVEDFAKELDDIYEQAEKTVEEILSEVGEAYDNFLQDFKNQADALLKDVDSPVNFDDLRVTEGFVGIQGALSVGFVTGYVGFDIAAGEGSIAGNAFSGFDIAARLNLGLEASVTFDQAEAIYDGDWYELFDPKNFTFSELLETGWSIQGGVVLADHMTAWEYGSSTQTAISVTAPRPKLGRYLEVFIQVNDNMELTLGFAIDLKLSKAVKKTFGDDNSVKASVQWTGSGTANMPNFGSGN